MQNVIQFPRKSPIESIINDLEDCHKALVSLKKEYSPMYRNLMVQWSNRRDELKAMLAKQVKYQPMFDMLKSL